MFQKAQNFKACFSLMSFQISVKVSLVLSRAQKCCTFFAATNPKQLWAKGIFLFSGFTVYLGLALTRRKTTKLPKKSIGVIFAPTYSVPHFTNYFQILFDSPPSPFMKSAFGKRPGVSRVLCSCGRLSNKTEAKSGGGGRIYSELESSWRRQRSTFVMTTQCDAAAGQMSLFSFEGVFPEKIFENSNVFFENFSLAWPVKVCRSLVSQKFSMVIFESTFISPSAYDDDGREGKVLFLFDFRQCETEKAKFSQEKGILRHTSP